MSISPAHVPPELHYIIPLAEKHGSEARMASFDRRLGRHVKYAEKLPKKLSNLFVNFMRKSIRRVMRSLSASGWMLRMTMKTPRPILLGRSRD